MTYNFTLYRPRASWQDFRLTGEGFTLMYRPGMENGFVLAAKVLVHLGRPDAPMQVRDSVDDSLSWDLPGITYLSTLSPFSGPAPTPSQEVYEDLCSLPARSLPLIARDYITPQGALTDAGRQAKQAYEDAQEHEDDSAKAIWLTPGQLAAFEIVRDGKVVQWNALHGKTRNFMTRQEWISLDGNKPYITDLGQKVWDGFVNRDRKTGEST